MTNTTVSRPGPQQRRRRRAHRALVVIAVIAVAVVVAVLAVGTHVVGRTVRYPDVFGPIPESSRPAPAPDGAQTYLLVGTDGGSPTRAFLGSPIAGRTIQVVRVAPDRASAQVIGISADSLAPVPGRGPGPLGSALVSGGPTGLVQAVEGLTGVRVDHFATVDFPGFRSLVDRFGGIDVGVAAPTTGGAPLVHLDGAQALAYLRVADEPGNEASRVAREQNVLRGLLTGAAHASPFALPGTIVDLSGSVGFDDSMGVWSILRLGTDIATMRGDTITFVTAPIAAAGAPGDQGRPTQLLAPSATDLFAALRDGRVGDWLAQNGPSQAVTAPR
ncbi:LCP family protein [Actinomycetospora termitidis]|uniref:LCP family protein n=1 Tax=Actinomycetospora termitidis TaxID=3053470 RepID=A0ABT7M777_9PSEU|nr:LCP family protein [Actinomycetospora sp. Odt1-22]MDL5155657.1 LCP family protein [Actinomycetospora sp. Odt1-22]